MLELIWQGLKFTAGAAVVFALAVVLSLVVAPAAASITNEPFAVAFWGIVSFLMIAAGFVSWALGHFAVGVVCYWLPAALIISLTAVGDV